MMNNAKIVIENMSLVDEQQVDNKPLLRAKETELTTIIEALDNIQTSKYWQVIQEKVLNGVLETLQRRIRSEKNPTEIYRLQGQIVWAEKYTDLSKLSQAYRHELQNIRKLLNV